VSRSKTQPLKQRCHNGGCNKLFRATQACQKFCSAKCRRRVDHIKHVTKYPEAREARLQKLLEWKKKHPLAKRVKRRFFPRVGMPTWLTGR
jgi:hypothetical protein